MILTSDDTMFFALVHSTFKWIVNCNWRTFSILWVNWNIAELRSCSDLAPMCKICCACASQYWLLLLLIGNSELLRLFHSRRYKDVKTDNQSERSNCVDRAWEPISSSSYSFFSIDKRQLRNRWSLCDAKEIGYTVTSWIIEIDESQWSIEYHNWASTSKSTSISVRRDIRSSKRDTPLRISTRQSELVSSERWQQIFRIYCATSKNVIKPRSRWSGRRILLSTWRKTSWIYVKKFEKRSVVNHVVWNCPRPATSWVIFMGTIRIWCVSKSLSGEPHPSCHRHRFSSLVITSIVVFTDSKYGHLRSTWVIRDGIF